jgi:tetratricopeptide (TPR) repeat protein
LAGSIICAACGGKVAAERTRCPRCGEPLVARQAAGAKGGDRRVTIAIVAVCIAVGAFSTIMLLGGPPTGSGQAAAPAAARVSPTGVGPAASVDAPREAPGATQGTAGASISDVLAGEAAYAAGDVAAALQRFQAAVDANPDDVRALNDLGQALVRLGRAKDAVTYLDTVVRRSPDSWTYQFNRARAHAELKDWGPAIDGYRAAGQLFPDDYATPYNLAKALQASGDLNGAIVSYERAIQLAPGQSDFQLSYGLALESAKRPQDAAAAYRRYLELEPQSPEADKVRAHLAEIQPGAPKAPGS